MAEDYKDYQIFQDSIIDLASSVVLKCDDAAQTLNQWVLGYTNATFDDLDRRTWKYYKNICGEYFASDEVMYITSLDTLAQIEFSKENLEYHRATKSAYAFGTTYYKELVDTYPNQELLIKGILYPADMDTAIDAYELQILAYPPTLVEDTEPSLIPKLQAWIDGYYRRWHNPQYCNTDNLYLTANLGVLFAMMPGAIENIRKAACGTYEAHSYHVKAYLASHSALDKYLPYMTRSQAMFFYHNLAYIENNNGREEIFEELLQRIFTDRKLPMGHFTLMHSTVDMPVNSLTPTAIFKKTPLNSPSNIDNRNLFTLSDVLDIESDIDPANIPYRTDAEPKIADEITYTLDPNVPTKLLESTVIDYSDSDTYRMSDIVLQHWLWLAWNGLYKAYITFVIPANGDRISLTPLDAFAFYAYAFCQGLGFELTTLPDVACYRVQRIPPATIDDMRKMVESSRVSDDWLKSTLATMPPPREIISIEAFHDHCHELFVAANEQYAFTALEEKMIARAQKEAAICQLWGDNYFKLGDKPGQTYKEWFASRNLVIDDLNASQYAEVADVILKEATGANLAKVISLADIQSKMRDMLVDLSSYSIQVGIDINTGPVIDAGSKQVRPDNIDASSEGQIYIQAPMLNPSNITTEGSEEAFIDLNEFPAVSNYGCSTADKIKFNFSSLVSEGQPSITINHRIDFSASYDCIVNLTAPNPRNLTIVPGMEWFLELPLEQQLASYVDTWAVQNESTVVLL